MPCARWRGRRGAKRVKTVSSRQQCPFGAGIQSINLHWRKQIMNLQTSSRILVISSSLIISIPTNAASAIASIKGHSTELNGISVGYASESKAKEQAIKSCKETARKDGIKGGCHVVISGKGPGYLAISFGDDGAGYGFAGTVQGAVDLAAEACQKSFNNCEIKNVRYWTDNFSPAPIGSNTNCRPNTPTIRCSSRCTNGDCVVTYENGCQMRVRVSPRFDGISNQWTYPSPSC